MTMVTGAQVLARGVAEAAPALVTGVLDDSTTSLGAHLRTHGIDVVPGRTARAAVRMAAGAALATGRPCVVIVSHSGTMLDALQAVADAQARGARLLVISTTRRADLVAPHEPGAPDALDLTGLSGSLLGSGLHVDAADRIERHLAGSWAAITGPAPAVAHLQLAESALVDRAPEREADASPRIVAAPRRTTAPPATIERVAALLVTATRVLVHAGRGVVHSGAEDQVRSLVAMLDAAVTTTVPARGVVAESDMHVVAPIHFHVVDDARTDADVVLVLGADMGESDWWGQPPHWGGSDQQVIQVDVDPTTFGRHRPATVAVLGDVGAVLDDLLVAVAAKGQRDTTPRLHWMEDLQADVRRNRHALLAPLQDESASGVHPAAAIAACRLALPEDVVWVLDGRHTTQWGTFHLVADAPRRLLTPGALATPGGGLAQAIGVAAALPDTAVCCLVGDGAMARQFGDLSAAVALGLDLVVVVFVDQDASSGHQAPRTPLANAADGPGRNGDGAQVPDGRSGGAERQDRAAQVTAAALRDRMDSLRADQMRFDLVARGLGAWGEHVTTPDGLGPALDRAAEARGPALVHVAVDRVDHVWTPEATRMRAQRQSAPG